MKSIVWCQQMQRLRVRSLFFRSLLKAITYHAPYMEKMLNKRLTSSQEYFYSKTISFSYNKIISFISSDVIFQNINRDVKQITEFDRVITLRKIKHIKKTIKKKIHNVDNNRTKNRCSLILIYLKTIECSRDELFLANRYMVERIVDNYATKYPDISDLYQEGCIGLMRGIYRHDPDRGTIQQYAWSWIVQSINRFIANTSRMIRLPAHFMEDVRSYKEKYTRFCLDNQHEPNVHNMCQETNLPYKTTLLIHNHLKPIIQLEVVQKCANCCENATESYSHNLNKNRIESFQQDLTEKQFKHPEDNIHQNDLNRILNSALSSLEKKEEQIIRLRFGVGAKSSHTLEEIGKIFDVSRERIRQIERKSLQKLMHPNRIDILSELL
jgi:RNA polymerase primary sigma factor